MPTITRFEKRCVARGKQEGGQEALLDILDARFNLVPEDIVEAVNKVKSPNLLKELVRAASRVLTLEEFRSHLPS